MMTNAINLLVDKIQTCIFILQHPNFRPGFEATHHSSCIKDHFSEKAAKICPIFLMILMCKNKCQNHEEDCPDFVSFLEKLNFTNCVIFCNSLDYPPFFHEFAEKAQYK